MSKTIVKKPTRMTETEAFLTAERLNESETKHSDESDRWFFSIEHVGNHLFEIVCTDNTGEEIARW